MKLKFYLSTGLITLLTSCATTKTYSIQAKSASKISGEIYLAQKNEKVELNVMVHHLKPNSKHAIHIHEFGDCSSEDGSSAGGHWNPTGHKHGKWGQGEFHAGDIGNLRTDNQGNAALVMKTDKWCLGCSDKQKNIIGKSIIIHEKADDYVSQPTGNAGGRVGCVEIR